MKRLRKILVTISQILFIGWILLFSFFVMAPNGEMPDKKWFEKFPVWFLLLINVFSLIVAVFIIWVMIQVLA